jgi:transcriptional regulator with XRE-family HTH domain
MANISWKIMKDKLKKIGRSQRDLAEEAGLNKATVSLIFNYKTVPTRAQTHALADAMNRLEARHATLAEIQMVETTDGQA